MSEIRDRFFELLSPTIEAEDFEFKKSKGCFVKTIGDLHHEISFRWDGRGGLVHLESIDLKINSISIEKAVKKLTFKGPNSSQFLFPVRRNINHKIGF